MESKEKGRRQVGGERGDGRTIASRQKSIVDEEEAAGARDVPSRAASWSCDEGVTGTEAPLASVGTSLPSIRDLSIRSLAGISQRWR